jgi:hypothetical protein
MSRRIRAQGWAAAIYAVIEISEEAYQRLPLRVRNAIRRCTRGHTAAGNILRFQMEMQTAAWVWEKIRAAEQSRPDPTDLQALRAGQLLTWITADAFIEGEVVKVGAQRIKIRITGPNGEGARETWVKPENLRLPREEPPRSILNV